MVPPTRAGGKKKRKKRGGRGRKGFAFIFGPQHPLRWGRKRKKAKKRGKKGAAVLPELIILVHWLKPNAVEKRRRAERKKGKGKKGKN